MAKPPRVTPPRVSIKGEGSIMDIREKIRSAFVQECVNEAFADRELYQKVMQRVTGSTVEDFLLPGEIIVDAATMQPVKQKPPKATPHEPTKPAPAAVPAAKPAPEMKSDALPAAKQKPAAQPSAGAGEAGEVFVPLPAEKPVERVSFDFIEEGT